LTFKRFNVVIFQINQIDQDTFNQLPEDIKIEILMSYKESLKRNNVKKAAIEFPEVGSRFQWTINYANTMWRHKISKKPISPSPKSAPKPWCLGQKTRNSKASKNVFMRNKRATEICYQFLE
jgi:hypothetical protein